MRHTNDPIYDLRSDTVTRPGDAMRRAMAEALVGDDVYREDPTALELEARAAEITGKEAALFMPTGSMGNQVALATWADRGTSVLCEARAHILLYEQGAMASLSGLTPAVLQGDLDGCLDPHEVERALRPVPQALAQLVDVVPPAAMREVLASQREERVDVAQLMLLEVFQQVT